MVYRRLKISNFRCIENADVDLDQRVSMIVGDNGAGKTSVLEAAYYLGRGRSFRQPRTDRLIRHGQPSFQLFGEIARGDSNHRVGIEASRSGHRIRIDGEEKANLSSIAERLVIQVIEPEIHTLVAEGPERRRKFLDYGVFHVEPAYLAAWRRYRKALKQRNAGLRQGQSLKQLAPWDQELIQSGEMVDSFRSGYVRMLREPVAEVCAALGLHGVSIDYRPGWDNALSMRDALEKGFSRDASQHVTGVGPHRADLRLIWRDRAAKTQVSRGQQKLLAAGLVLAQTRLLAGLNDDQVVLLVDDPAAELDKTSLARLMAQIRELPGQLIMTAIDAQLEGLPGDAELFHVEQGVVTR